MDALMKMDQAKDLLDEAIRDLTEAEAGRLKAETVATLLALSRAIDKAQARLEMQLTSA